jgi:DNA primase
LGTAVTASQLQMMWRISDEPVIALDGDDAGLRAAQKVIDVALPLLEAGKGLRFALLPQGKDPDDLIRTEGPGALQAVLDAARPMVDLLWERAVQGQSFDSPERRAALDKSLRTAVGRIADASVRHHYGQAIRDRLWALYRSGPRRHTRRPGPGGASDGAKRSLLASGDAAETRLREAVVLAVILTAPELAAEVEARLEALTCTDPQHARLRDAILASIGDEEAMRGRAARAIGEDGLETLFSARHLQVVPCIRNPGDTVLARNTVTEALDRLEAQRSWQAELAEAEADAVHWTEDDDKPATWRLQQAARSRNGAGRHSEEADADYDVAPNGAQISKDERQALDSLLARIRFDRTEH